MLAVWELVGWGELVQKSHIFEDFVPTLLEYDKHLADDSEAVKKAKPRHEGK